jgi:hypothetical protein
MPVDITEYADAIDNALADGTFCVVATNGSDGIPDVGFKGSMMVFDKDRLAYWERTRGTHLANLRREPGVAVLYFNRERGKHLRFFGRAELYEDGPIREQIMAQTVQAELDRDPERTGIGVLIRVDVVEDAYARSTQRREQEAV